MATKLRKDYTAIDFRIVSSFKHNLLKLTRARAIDVVEFTPAVSYQQMWYKSGLGWKESGLQSSTEPCFDLSMRDFRAVVRSLARDVKTVTEPLVIATLIKFSLFVFKSREPKWKFVDEAGIPRVWLEYNRLNKNGTIGHHHDPDSLIGQWKAHIKFTTGTMHNRNLDYEEAVKFNHEVFDGMTLEQAVALKQKVIVWKAGKDKNRDEIDKKIRERF